MRVKIIRPCWIEGARATPGSTMELDKAAAIELIQMGRVIKAPQVETATAEPGETRARASRTKSKK